MGPSNSSETTIAMTWMHALERTTCACACVCVEPREMVTRCTLPNKQHTHRLTGKDIRLNNMHQQGQEKTPWTPAPHLQYWVQAQWQQLIERICRAEMGRGQHNSVLWMMQRPLLSSRIPQEQQHALHRQLNAHMSMLTSITDAQTQTHVQPPQGPTQSDMACRCESVKGHVHWCSPGRPAKSQI